ncbi:flavin reductase family protein [Polluticoccus soli]|uniref:flavin reductase family protein n=1 Tax=Polluticoccus soli TaxID=3034150 RepID=UPI0023E09B5E|nr:iron-sulfur cluster-binding domain-containing protein [Flavipsychrobacter sp. JY13-12]
MLPSTGEFRLVQILDIHQETSDVKTFVLNEEMDYRAGQFLTVLSQDGNQRRSYSFSTAPGIDKNPAITVKRVANGVVSRHLIDELKPGDHISVSGPFGFFTLPDDMTSYRQVVLLAAGVGITPILSLLRSLLSEFPDVHTTLIYSNSSKKSAIFYSELQELEHLHPNKLVAEFLFSNSPNLLRARLNKQFLPELLHQHLKADNEKTLFYLCGPFPYMRMVQLALEEENVPAQNIKKENFNTSVITQKLEPPDKESHSVSITFKGERRVFETAYPDTILSSAKKAGLELPYSCENGICGSCVAQCTHGKVWHRNNEVLTDAELKKGLILTCTGYPVEGNIELTIK